MRNKTFLITGGAGFIGSAVIRHILNNTNHKVINVDKLTYAGNLDNLSSISKSKNYSFEEVDICNKKEIERIYNCYQPDIIMHLAAESHVDRSIYSSNEFIQTNIIGTYALLEQTRKYIIEIKKEVKFHHISTDEVFGDLGRTKDLFTEETPYNPSSPYSASKASSDHLVRSWEENI